MASSLKRKSPFLLIGISLALLWSPISRANRACVQVLDGSISDTHLVVKKWSFDPLHPNIFRRLGVNYNVTAAELNEAYHRAKKQYQPESNIEIIQQRPELKSLFELMASNIQLAFDAITTELENKTLASIERGTLLPRGYNQPRLALAPMYIKFLNQSKALASGKVESVELSDYQNRLEDLFIYDATSALDVREFLLSLANSSFENVAAKINFYLGTKPQYVEFRNHLLSVAANTIISPVVRWAAFKGMLTSFESSKEFRDVLAKELVSDTPLKFKVLEELILTGANRLGAIDLAMQILPYQPQAIKKQIYEFLVGHSHIEYVKRFLIQRVKHGEFPDRDLKMRFLDKVGYKFSSNEDREILIDYINHALKPTLNLREEAENIDAAVTAISLLVKHHHMMSLNFIFSLASSNAAGRIRLEAIRALKFYFYNSSVKTFLIQTASDPTTNYIPKSLPAKLAAIDVLGELTHISEVRATLQGILIAHPRPDGAVLQRVRVILRNYKK